MKLNLLNFIKKIRYKQEYIYFYVNKKEIRTLC